MSSCVKMKEGKLLSLFCVCMAWDCFSQKFANGGDCWVFAGFTLAKTNIHTWCWI